MARVTTSDGLAVELRDLGGEGEPVLFGHPMGFHGAVMGPLARRLHGIHGYAFDLRAHGASAPGEGHVISTEGFAADVLACAQAITVETGRPVRAMGHSGGGTALLAAELSAPGTFRSIFLYEPALRPREDGWALNDESEIVTAARRRRDWFPSIEDALVNYAAKAPTRSFTEEALRAYVEEGFAPTPAGTVELRCRPEQEVEVYLSGMFFEVFERLGDIGCPVVVAAGTAGGPDRRGGRDPVIAAALPQGEHLPVAGLDHFAPQSDPDGLAPVVQAWLDAAG